MEITNPIYSQDFMDKAIGYAIKCHHNTNHTYDGQNYSLHLRMVYTFASKYLYLLPEELRCDVLASTWTHDVIEDCRETYNDVKEVLGKTIAEITYALTNLKGKTRAERASAEYYQGIRETPGAAFVKICDRLANATYSKRSRSSMFQKYKDEQPKFEKELFNPTYKKMFDELNTILEL